MPRNPGQWIEQYVNRTAEFVQRRITQMITSAPQGQEPWGQAFAYAIEFLKDINPNYGALVESKHPTLQAQIGLIQEIIADGFYLQVSPFQKGIDQKFILKLKEKYGVTKSRVTFTVRDNNGVARQVTSKKPVMIGYEYFYLLYKMPHMRSSGIGYVNQFHSPVRASALAKLQYPFSQTPIRLGEDEIRNIVMTSGVEAAVHILGAYANSPTAVENMAHHLYFDQQPAQLKQIDLTLPEIIRSNSIVGVTKHMFACAGINIAPKPEEVARIMASASVVTDDEDQTDEKEELEDK